MVRTLFKGYTQKGVCEKIYICDECVELCDEIIQEEIEEVVEEDTASLPKTKDCLLYTYPSPRDS